MNSYWLHKGMPALLALLWIACCGSNRLWAMQAPEIMQKQQECRNAANDTLEQLYALHPEARQQVRQAAGYAAFEQITPKILIVGGGSGKGIAVENRTQRITYMKVTDSIEEVSLGIKQYAAVLLFDSPEAYRRFISHGWRLSEVKTASASGKNQGHPAAIPIAPDVWLYQIADDSLLLTLLAKGIQFYPDDDLNHGL